MPTQEHIPQKFIKTPLTVGVVGAGFSGGQPRGGVELGPTRLIEFGLISQLQDLGWTVDFDEKFPNYEHLKPKEADIGKLKNAKYVSAVTQSVSKSVREICEKGAMALTLGGDHSLAMGTISGSASVYKDVGVIWVDAHADINTPDTTPSGNLHGCPVSFLMGLGTPVPEFSWLTPCLPANRIVFIGLRDIDPGEKAILKQHSIKAYSMYDVDRHGIGKIMEMALEYLGEDTPIHLSFDVDALDPTVAPSTGTPVRGGLTFREGHFICERVHETGRLVAVDLMEVNPTLGDQASLVQTVQIGCSLVRSALGETLL
ncbi:Arginase, catabolizes arginine to ornithine and urea [Rhizophlyctis rosea]|uniref:Arginase n=1 Tax=Rhizophlyctis rosea TaxID=64517 RepID=A0AAD5S5H6_9FUNG|nr:Arginase, catabolizes arginine to ornithine and urea [Rhizophlyctis rosea]